MLKGFDVVDFRGFVSHCSVIFRGSLKLEFLLYKNMVSYEKIVVILMDL